MEKISREVRIAPTQPFGYKRTLGSSEETIKGFVVLRSNNQIANQNQNGDKLVVFVTEPDDTVSANIYQIFNNVLKVRKIPNVSTIVGVGSESDYQAITNPNEIKVNNFTIRGYRPGVTIDKQPYLEIILQVEAVNPVRTVTGARADQVTLDTTVVWRQYD